MLENPAFIRQIWDVAAHATFKHFRQWKCCWGQPGNGDRGHKHDPIHGTGKRKKKSM